MAALIPKLLHRVWIGDNPIPDEYEWYWETWKRHHPGWELITWRPADFLPLRNSHEYERAEGYAQKSDIARYEILHRHGGVYIDTDFECLRPLDDLIDDLEGFAATEDGQFVSIGIVGATPRHPFIDQLVAMVPYSIANQPDKPVNHQTGPWLATRVSQEGAAVFRPPVLKIFPASYFYPYRYDELYRRNERFPDAYAVHHWAGSWLGQAAPQRRPEVARVLLRLDWSRPPTPDPVVRRFAELFSAGDPVELAIPLDGADPQAALTRLAEYLQQVAADPASMANVVLYTDDEIPSLEVAASVDRGSHDETTEDAFEVLEQQRRRIDAYRALVSASRTA